MSQASKVEMAISRFETALHKLEASMVKVHQQGDDLSTSQGESDALRIEQDQLNVELAAVRSKAEELSDINRQAAKRVDNAMIRIKKVLG